MFYLKNKIIRLDKVKNIEGKDTIHTIRCILQYMNCIYKETESLGFVEFRIPILDTTIDWWFIPKDMYDKLPIEESYKINYTGKICHTGDTNGIDLTSNEKFLELFNTKNFISVHNTLGKEYTKICNRLLSINLDAKCNTSKFNTNCDLSRTALSYYYLDDVFSNGNYRNITKALDLFGIKYSRFEIDDSNYSKVTICALHYLEFDSELYCFNKNIEDISTISCTVADIKLLISIGALIKLDDSAIELVEHLLSLSSSFSGMITSTDDYENYCNK